MNYYPVTDGQTARLTDRQKAMHMSPPCNMHRWAQQMVYIIILKLTLKQRSNFNALSFILRLVNAASLFYEVIN